MKSQKQRRQQEMYGYFVKPPRPRENCFCSDFWVWIKSFFTTH